MRQKNLVKQVYEACLEHDAKRQEELRRLEFQKILKHKQKGKKFTARWTLMQV